MLNYVFKARNSEGAMTSGTLSADTPTLDKLGKEGVVFSRAVATSSWTIPAVMSVFTSLYPGVHRTTDYRKKLPEKIGTLAEVLKKNGFMTAAFVSTTVLDSRYGFSRGFDL